MSEKPRSRPEPTTAGSRRGFVKSVAASAALAAGFPSLLKGEAPNSVRRTLTREPLGSQIPPSDRIGLAVIGAGGMGMADVSTALRIPGVELVAACDVFDGRLEAARERYGADLFTTRDYREVLARDDIDAVIVGTPDHWHQPISVDALRAGKAVYCEKPMVHDIAEGHDLLRAQEESGRVFQVGSQGMSSLGNEKAKELYEAGAIGQLNYAEGFWARNDPIGAWQYPIPAGASEETVDWKRFLGPAPDRPYDPLRVFRWRNYRDYGTGVAGDLFVHLFSSLHFVVSSRGPTRIQAAGGLRYWKDGREVPDVLLGVFDYPETNTHPGFNLSLRVNFVDGTSGSTYLRLVGSEGAMDVTWTEVIMRKNVAVDPMDAFSQEKMAEAAADEGSLPARVRMRPPAEASAPPPLGAGRTPPTPPRTRPKPTPPRARCPPTPSPKPNARPAGDSSSTARPPTAGGATTAMSSPTPVGRSRTACWWSAPPQPIRTSPSAATSSPPNPLPTST